MKLCCISDQHNHLPKIDKDVDLLLNAGDYFHTGRNVNDQFFIWNKKIKPWLRDIASNGTKIISCAGNHDHFFEKNRSLIEDEFRLFNGEYVEHGMVKWNGLIIACSSWQPIFFDWAFNRESKDLQRLYSQLPSCDILLTHSPAFGYHDYSPYGQCNAGSKELLAELPRLHPRLAVAGHFHHDVNYGITTKQYLDGLSFSYVGASLLNEKYQLTREPIYLEFD